MQHQKNKPGKADTTKNRSGRSSDDRQEGNELFVDSSQRLDEEDVKENDITGAAADAPGWDNAEEDNRNFQGNDKAPEEEQGIGEKVTIRNLKGKQVDEDPSTADGTPLKP